MVLKYTCPNVQAPIVDPKTGMGTRAWYQYLQNIFDTVDVDLLTTTNSWEAQQNFNVIAVTSFSVSNLSVTSASIQSLTVSNTITSLTVSNLTISSLTFATPTSNSLTGDVFLNVTTSYFDGPTVTQGTIGTWFASGNVTVQDNLGTANIAVKLWDGTTVIDSGLAHIDRIGASEVVHLSGVIINPAGNLRISAKDTTSTQGMIMFNGTGESKDSTLTVYRIG